MPSDDLLQPPLRVLLVEDSAADAELLRHHLVDAGIKIHIRRVDSAETMFAALADGPLDLILSDYSLPGFDGIHALELLRETGLDIPFILLSGNIGEDFAVTALKAGAHDFVTKGNLARLVPAIDRELREAGMRRKRREAETALQETQRKLAAISDAANDAILLMDLSHRVSFWNPAAERMFGYPQEQALGKDLLDLIIAPQYRADFRQVLLDSLCLEETPKSGKVIELSGQDKDGREILLEGSLSTILLGGRWHAVGILRDITRRKAMEREWKEQFHFFQTVIEAIPNPIYYKDAKGRFLGCNRAFENYIGRPMREVIGKTLQDLVPADLVSPHHKADMEILGGGNSVTYEAEVTDADASIRAVIESKAPFFDMEGRIAGIVGTMLDITDRKRSELEKSKLEIQLRQAQKLEAIGQLAAGIAHEINTPTQFIGDNTVFLRNAFAGVLDFLQWQAGVLGKAVDNQNLSPFMVEMKQRMENMDLNFLIEEIPKAINQTSDGVARVIKIVGAMKNFSHPGLESVIYVDLNQSIESTLIISHNEWKYLAEVETEFDPELPPVPCYPGEFNQVILNLVVNAAHAIEEVKSGGKPDHRGVIRISTRHVGSEVVIRIEDNGTGIPQIIRNRIFDPFFTTKAIGKGTGQGLAIAHSVIVDKHKGRIDLESEVGKGTIFTIALPTSRQA
jgi:PAS domain S-box-containing protein